MSASISTNRSSPRTLSPTSRRVCNGRETAPMPPVLRSFAEMDCTALQATSLIMRSIARPTVLSGLEDRLSRAGGLAALEAHFGVGVEGERAHRSPPCKTPSPEPYCRRQAASGQLLAGGWRCRCVVRGLAISRVSPTNSICSICSGLRPAASSRRSTLEIEIAAGTVARESSTRSPGI